MTSRRLVGWGAVGVLLVIFGLDASLRSVELLPLMYVIVVTVTAFASGPRVTAAIATLALLLALLAGFVNGDNISPTHWLRVSLVCTVGIMALVFSLVLARGVRRADTATAHYRMIAENASDVVLVWGMDHRLQWVSPSVEQVLGWKPEDLLGCTIAALLDPADIERIRGIQQAVRAGGGDSARTEAPHATASGGRRWMAITGRALVDPDGTVTGSVEALRDIQSEVEARNALVETEQHYRLIAENTSDVVIRWNNQSRVEWVSPSVKEVLGWEPDELVGKSITDLLFPDDYVRISAMKRDLLARGLIDGNVEGRYATAAGQWRWMAVHGHAIKDDTGAIVGGVEGLRDIQTEHESRELLGYMAAHDPLTRLANRGEFFTRIGTLISHGPRSGTLLGILFIDVDDLKQINDSHGHAAGDTVIAEIAQRIESCVRTDDLVARYGGDEFVAALTAIHGIEDAEAVAAKIQLEVLTPIRLTSHSLRVDVSIGVAVAEPGDSLEDVLHRADQALYAAKAAGRGRTMTDVQARAMGSSAADLVN